MPGRSPVNFLTQTIIFIIIALFVLPGVSAYAAEVTLQWDKPDDDRVKGYYIYYGKASESSYDFESADPNITIEDPETTSTELSDLEAGEDYEVAATSFDEDGNESEFSDVVTFTAPEDEDESDEDTSGDDTTSDDENNDSSSSDDESNTDSDTEDQEQDTTDENTDQETNDSQDESDEDSSGDDTTSDDENNDSSSSDDESNSEETDNTDTEDNETESNIDSEIDESLDLYHAVGFFHNGEFGTEFLNFGFDGQDKVVIESKESSSSAMLYSEAPCKIYQDGEMTIDEDKKGALSADGNFFTLGATGGQYPSTTLGIRQTSGLTAADLEGDYRVFLIQATQDDSSTAEIQKGVISADGFDHLSADQETDLDFESFYYVDEDTGHLSLEPEGAYSAMDGALSAQGRIFAAVDADDSDGTLLFIIGIRISEDTRATDPSGDGYYVNQFRYENEESPAGSFLELLIESDLSYDSYEIDSTAGAVLEDSSGTLSVDETGLIQGESDNDGDNLSGAVAPDGEVLVVQDESLLGVGIRQSSDSSDSSSTSGDGGGGGGSSAGCFIGTLSF